ncbi:piezo-type mechanosensitive ion channel homolog isoform X4 [Gossypium hirsutum]|uniref:Piezo-type mechanosensitive ion channel homolog isoform X4 n=1 Tax=Gossypium hirsutum TaxID=3635 RepID=A0A1U8IJL1_GOSHI|nr:piezo-type mechanosensitive ion channel homolog isoform X4 [Gossypium hirsutum]XP_040941282.1 piezo-type mechanosensitive ion channel homolog isoform X4 [Gossypium hirsutum]
MEMDFIMSARASSLTRQLLPSKHSFFIRESRSSVRHTNILLRGPILRTFGINYFTYGFPEPKGWSEPLGMIMGAAASTDKTCTGLQQVNQEALLELN